MADPKVSGFLIGMVWVGFFVLIFGTFLANLSTNYGTDQENTDATWNRTFNKMDALQSTAELLRNESNIDEKEGAIDIIGGYFSGGYRVLKATWQSIDLFNEMNIAALADDNLDIVGVRAFQQAIGITILIIIIVAITISAIMKWRL